MISSPSPGYLEGESVYDIASMGGFEMAKVPDEVEDFEIVIDYGCDGAHKNVIVVEPSSLIGYDNICRWAI